MSEPAISLSPAHLTPCHARHMATKLRTLLDRFDSWDSELATFGLSTQSRERVSDASADIRASFEDILAVVDEVGDKERADSLKEEQKRITAARREAERQQRERGRQHRLQAREERKKALLGARTPVSAAPAPSATPAPAEVQASPSPEPPKASGKQQKVKTGGEPRTVPADTPKKNNKKAS
jgi:hypothetical protein